MILVFGSINADLLFEMDALPAPGQTLLAKTLRIEAGGKGANQALAARCAGADVVMAGAVGRDPLAAVALANLRTEGVDLARVATAEAPTGCASICTDPSGRNQIAVAPGANAAAKQGGIDDALLARASLLLLQGESDIAEVETLIFRAKRAGVRSVLNLAPAVRVSDDALRAVDLLVVNEDEAQAVARWFACPPTAAGLHAALGAAVIRTLGHDGSEAATRAGAIRVPAVPITPVDTTAAGDCFVGVLAAGLDRGEALKPAMERASEAAARACLVRGSQVSVRDGARAVQRMV